MARVDTDISHSAISRALATLGERAGGTEVASALRCDWEPFEAQMRRRMRSRPREHRSAYLCLARAGAEKVRFHLEATGALPRREDLGRRSPGAVIRVRERGRRLRARRGSGQGGRSVERRGSEGRARDSRPQEPGHCGSGC